MFSIFFDKIKRRVYFWKYTKIKIDLPEEMINEIKYYAKTQRVSFEAKCEDILKNYFLTRKANKHE